MGVDKLLKYAIAIAIGFAAKGHLIDATKSIQKDALQAIRFQQISYRSFNMRLQSTNVRPHAKKP